MTGNRTVLLVVLGLMGPSLSRAQEERRPLLRDNNEELSRKAAATGNAELQNLLQSFEPIALGTDPSKPGKLLIRHVTVPGDITTPFDWNTPQSQIIRALDRGNDGQDVELMLTPEDLRELVRRRQALIAVGVGDGSHAPPPSAPTSPATEEYTASFDERLQRTFADTPQPQSATAPATSVTTPSRNSADTPPSQLAAAPTNSAATPSGSDALPSQPVRNSVSPLMMYAAVVLVAVAFLVLLAGRGGAALGLVRVVLMFLLFFVTGSPIWNPAVAEPGFDLNSYIRWFSAIWFCIFACDVWMLRRRSRPLKRESDMEEPVPHVRFERTGEQGFKVTLRNRAGYGWASMALGLTIPIIFAMYLFQIFIPGGANTTRALEILIVGCAVAYVAVQRFPTKVEVAGDTMTIDGTPLRLDHRFGGFHVQGRTQLGYQYGFRNYWFPGGWSNLEVTEIAAALNAHLRRHLMLVNTRPDTTDD